MAERWDLFCRVIDNYGDIGVCWRLARQLHQELGVSVRLWVDRLDVFAHLCPQLSTALVWQQVDGIEICQWDSCSKSTEPAHVVIEAFACEIPDCYQQSLHELHRSQPDVPIVWINLEYLSAEDWVTECHGLATPGSSSGLRKHFFFPGFTGQTGGLIQEAGLPEKRIWFQQWLESQGSCTTSTLWAHLRGASCTATDPAKQTLSTAKFSTKVSGYPQWDEQLTEELRVSLFSYHNPLIPKLLEHWSTRGAPTSLFVTSGLPTTEVAKWCGRILNPGDELQIGALRLFILPFLSPATYDELLWSCDFNFVRGEDSFVRAQWANRPLIWHIYPQEDAAHHKKLDAFLSLYLRDFSHNAVVSEFWRLWNHIPPECSRIPSSGIEDAWENLIDFRLEWMTHCQDWADRLDRKGNLANNLAMFVRNIREQTLISSKIEVSSPTD